MIATTIEQSKRLLELGLKPETADMMWEQHFVNIEPILTVKPNTTRGKSIGGHSCNAWSLSALLDMIPKCITVKKRDYFAQISLTSNCIYYEYISDETPKHHLLTMFENDSIDGENSLLNNTYRMIVWLIEHKHLKHYLI